MIFYIIIIELHWRGEIMLDNLYENIGSKIKNLAKWILIIETIGAIIMGLVLFFVDDSLILFGLLTLVCGPIVAYIGSWILYAFGELVEDVHAIRNKEITTTDSNKKSRMEERAKQYTDKGTIEEIPSSVSVAPITFRIIPQNTPKSETHVA